MADPTPSPQAHSRITHHRGWHIVGLTALLSLTMITALMMGPMKISARDLGLWALNTAGFHAESPGPSEKLVIERIRLPRILLAAIVGAGLAVAGAAFQGLFRNPLADPSLIGVSAGGAMCAVGVIVLGHHLTHAHPWLGPFLLPVAAFIGSLGAILVIHRISLLDGRPIVATMILAGVGVNAFAAAATGFLTFLGSDQQVRDLSFWLLGSMAAATWTKIGIILPAVVLIIALLPSRALDALLLGESEAGHLGFNVARATQTVIVLAAIIVGLCVAFTGIIGFVGLIVPHAIRLIAGPGHRFLIPASALLGATLLVVADLGARCLVAPAELPIGVITALLGAPFFLALLMRTKGAWQP